MAFWLTLCCLLLILFLTAWDGHAGGLQVCWPGTPRLWAAGEGLAPEPPLVPIIAVKPKGEPAA